MDRSKLEQVLMNAVVNSRAAMPSGGRLDHRDRRPSRTASFVVSDASPTPVCGMAPEVAARAFEPFFTTKGRGNGTGLGLATAYGVVTDAGGTIALESQPDQGTTVRVRLPVGDGAWPAADALTERACLGGRRRASGSSSSRTRTGCATSCAAS